MTKNPSVLVIGEPQLAAWLSGMPATWTVLPAAANTDALWDGIESGALPSDAAVLVAAVPPGDTTDFEATIGEFAQYARVLLLADPTAGGRVADGARRYVADNGGTLPEGGLTILPVHDSSGAENTLRAATAELVEWPAPTPVPAVQQPPVQQPPAQQPPVQQPPAQQPPADYSQSGVYAAEIAQQVVAEPAKLAGAIPGQTTIAVMSSKGGSGKSTTAFSLAATIARTSAAAGKPKRVALVDLDTRDGQVGSLLGQYMPTAINIRVHPVWDAATVQEYLVRDKKLGFDALLAPVRPRNADDVGPEFYKHIIQVLQTTHDVVILDCSVNYLDPLLGTAFNLSDEILFVTTLASTSVQGMARSLTELFADPADGGLGIPPEKVGVVANQVISNVAMGKDKLLRAALGAPLVGQIPSDQDAVLIATNTNRMGDLLKHPRLGPAYYRLATVCLPDWDLAPITAEMTPHSDAPSEAPAGETKKKGLFRR